MEIKNEIYESALKNYETKNDKMKILQSIMEDARKDNSSNDAINDKYKRLDKCFKYCAKILIKPIKRRQSTDLCDESDSHRFKQKMSVYNESPNSKKKTFKSSSCKNIETNKKKNDSFHKVRDDKSSNSKIIEENPLPQKVGGFKFQKALRFPGENLVVIIRFER